MEKWLGSKASSLKGKQVVITGATGGLGREICRYVLSFGGSILMINRNEAKSRALREALLREFPGAQVRYLTADRVDMAQVRSLCARLEQEPLDVLMLNAGTYAIPRGLSSAGFDTVFQTNFLSHYYMVKALLPHLIRCGTRVVATGSIAHGAVRLDPLDPDYAHHQGNEAIYGNSKRFLIHALMMLLRDVPQVSFAVGHPGISFTGITSHYPPKALKIVKPSMLVLFMHPQKACRSMVRCIFEDVPDLHWVGPRVANIWGDPRISPLPSCEASERQQIFAAAEAMYEKIR